MTRPFVVDANAFKKIYDDLVSGTEDVGKAALDLILREDHILLDQKGRIRHEWRSCVCGEADEFFSSWITQRIIEDKIREAPNKVDRALKSKLIDFGMPKDDQVYFFLATRNGAYGIISEDSDLYDPKAKLWPSKRKQKLKEGGKSCVAKYMRRKFGVLLFPIAMTPDHFAA